MNDNDGGPAFPFTGEESTGCYEIHAGMTLRDYFAAQALAGLTSSKSYFDAEEFHAAKYCYRLADAMLKERAK